MPSGNASSPDNGYFNDLSRQPNHRSSRSNSPPDRLNARLDKEREEAGISKLKRIACIICRRRKLKCDGSKPSCGTCSRLGHKCAYDEVRRKSGPKRGYVKELEARLGKYLFYCHTLFSSSKEELLTRCVSCNSTGGDSAQDEGSSAPYYRQFSTFISSRRTVFASSARLSIERLRLEHRYGRSGFDE